ncbi:hypothetical protein [Pedobacter foliorum]|uniref:hypothetical protein n=1 Tax=Pedobacter foliorum TaxID=2739058 RepID=UPI001565F5D3|nr:hypothetical protein [Pedobacter foliorum]NRF37482.1 hypothetical protein [Pedobacter foliorum]
MKAYQSGIKKNHLLTPQNAALVIIDYQPVQVNSITSIDRQLLVNNIVGVTKIAKLYRLPIILPTVNLKTALNAETTPQLRKEMTGLPSYDRSTVN